MAGFAGLEFEGMHPLGEFGGGRSRLLDGGGGGMAIGIEAAAVIGELPEELARPFSDPGCLRPHGGGGEEFEFVTGRAAPRLGHVTACQVDIVLTRFPGSCARGYAVLAAGEFLRSRRLLDPQTVDLVDRLAAVVFQRLDRGMAAIGLRSGGGTLRLGSSEAASGRFHRSLGGEESLIGPARLLLRRADRLVRSPFVTGDAAQLGPRCGDRLARLLSPPGGLGNVLRACVDRRLEGIDLLLTAVDGAGESCVALVERSQLAPPRDEPRCRRLHADTELAVHREARAVAGEEERAGRRCLKQRQGVLDPLDDPDSAQQAANEITIVAGGWFHAAVDEQSVEPPDDAGMQAGIERGRLVQVPGREEADPAPRGEHRVGIIGRRPVRMPGDRFVERVNHEALAKFA